MIVTVFDSLYSAKPSYHHHLQVLDRIKNGGPLNGIISEIRAEADKDSRNNLKKKLPIICFGGKFSERKKSALIEASGLLVLDFDSGDVAKLRKQFEAKPYTVAAFSGPSGAETSLKVLIRIPLVENDEGYKAYFGYIESRMIDLDKSGKDICRATFYSHDPETYINPNATEFSLPKGYIETMSNPQERLASICDKVLTSPKGQSHQDLLAAAYTAGGLVSSGLIPESVAIRALEDAADTRRPKEFKDSRDAIKTALDAGKAKPLYDDEGIGREVQRFVRPKRVINVSNVIVSEDDMDENIGKFYDGTMELGRGIGVPDFDHFIRYRQNAFYYMVGKKGGGKTTIMLYLLLLDAVKNNSRYLICGIENSPHALRNQLISFLLQDSAKYVYEHDRQRYERSKKFISDRFVFLKYDDDWILSDILEVANKLHEERGFNAIMIDPYNAIRVPNSSNSFQYHVDCANACRRFSDKHFSVFLTGHPTSSKQREGTAPKDVDGEGGGTFPNKAHVTIAIHRDVKGEGDARHTTDLSVDKVREKELFGGDETMDAFPIRLVFDWKKYGFRVSLPLPGESGYASLPVNLLEKNNL